MQICVHDHVEVHPQKKKERSSLFGKKNREKKNKNNGTFMDINCEV